MHFVKDHHADAWKLRVVLKSSRQYTLRHHLDLGCLTDVSLVAGLIADEFADRCVGGRCHPSCRGTGRETSRLQHHYSLLGQPRLSEQRDRDHSRLAGPRRGYEDCPFAFSECRPHCFERVEDRKVRECVPGHWLRLTRSAECGRTVERTRVIVSGNQDRSPRRCLSDRLGHCPPFWRIPAFRYSGNVSVDPDERERRKSLQAHRSYRSSFWVTEDEVLLGQRPEKCSGVFGAGRDDQIDSCVCVAELFEDSGCGSEHPGTLVGVRVEHNGRQMERRQPIHDRAGLTETLPFERGERQVGREPEMGPGSGT